MSDSKRIAIASYGPDQFRLLTQVVRDLGHHPAVHLMSPSMRSGGPVEPDMLSGLTAVVSALTPEIGLLLPSGKQDIQPMLAGYDLDLLLVFGFNWRIPAEVVRLPRFGTLNVHSSLLPRFRGPAPVLWAIRSGDPELGVTVHRMTEEFDAGPVLAQGTVGRIPEVVTATDIWDLVRSGLPALLRQAIPMALGGAEGTPQAADSASYAGFPTPDWFEIDWTQDRLAAHHQIRTYRLLRGGTGPTADVDGRRIRILRTSPEEQSDLSIDCADGPLWITEYDEL